MITTRKWIYNISVLPFIIFRLLCILLIYPLLLLPMSLLFYIMENNEDKSFFEIWWEFINALVPEKKQLSNKKK